MTEEQEKIIREKAKLSGWKCSLTQDIIVFNVTFDLYSLLPDRNIIAFICECPTPPEWGWTTDEDTGVREYYFREADWRRQCMAHGAISNPGRFTPQELEAERTEITEECMSILLKTVQEATDYTKRKSQKEMAEMWVEFVRIRLEGPPKKTEDELA